MSNNVINNSFENEKLENAACDKFENLINSFSTESHSDGEKAVQFPNEYGGAFYADGKLNICVTDVSEGSSVTYNEVIGDNNVNYIKCAFSYNYLLEVNNYIVNLMTTKNDLYNINTISVIQKDNIVKVTVSTSENAEALKNDLMVQKFDSKSFDVIVDASRPKPVATYARPGDRVYNWTSSGRGSHIATICCNAKKNSNSQKGFVTAEHALWNRQYLGIYEYNCSSVSNCTASKATDSCFVPFDDKIANCTGLISNTNLYGNATYQITKSVGSSKNLEGVELTGFGKTSGIYTGKVVSTKYSYTLEGSKVTVSDALQIKCIYQNPTPTGGDSGGCIVQVTDSTTSPKTVTLAGLLSGATDYTSSSGNYTLAAVPKIHNIISALDITLVGGSN